MSNTEELLITELTQMFERQNLENNKYLLGNMQMSLAIPQNFIFNEWKIKTISQNHDEIKQALKKVANVQYDEKNQLITPLIKPKQNIIFIQNDKDISLLIQQTQESLKNKEYQLNTNRLIFEKEEDCKSFYQDYQKMEKEKIIEMRLEEESVYISMYKKMHQQISQQNMSQNNMDPTQMMMMNMMMMNPFMMMPFMQNNNNQIYDYNFQQNMLNTFQKNKFFIRKSNDNNNINSTTQEQKQTDEKIIITKKEPKKKDEKQKRDSIKGERGDKVVYYDEEEEKKDKVEINFNSNQVENKNELQNDDDHVKIKYSLNQIVQIFKSINQSSFTYDKKLDDFQEEGIINTFQTLEVVQPSQITEEMRKMILTSCQNTPQVGPKKDPVII